MPLNNALPCRKIFHYENAVSSFKLVVLTTAAIFLLSGCFKIEIHTVVLDSGKWRRSVKITYKAETAESARNAIKSSKFSVLSPGKMSRNKSLKWKSVWNEAALADGSSVVNLEMVSAEGVPEAFSGSLYARPGHATGPYSKVVFSSITSGNGNTYTETFELKGLIDAWAGTFAKSAIRYTKASTKLAPPRKLEARLTAEIRTRVNKALDTYDSSFTMLHLRKVKNEIAEAIGEAVESVKEKDRARIRRSLLKFLDNYSLKGDFRGRAIGEFLGSELIVKTTFAGPVKDANSVFVEGNTVTWKLHVYDAAHGKLKLIASK